MPSPPHPLSLREGGHAKLGLNHLPLITLHLQTLPVVTAEGPQESGWVGMGWGAGYVYPAYE